MIRGEHKLTRSHLERIAIVYVRQSTLVQVREHTESTLRQYDLAAQAARLGWPGTAIEVIDAGLGLSGTGSSSWSPACAWARWGRCSGWRSPGSPAPTPALPGCWSWPA